jgi:hypothetical protein
MMPPPRSSEPFRELVEEEDEVPETPFVDVVPAAGCPSRTSPRATAKPVTAERATTRFAAAARLRPCSILVA